MTVTAAGKNYSKAFTDGVGPALVSGSVLENDGPNPDILYLAFSEPIAPSSLMGKQLLLMSAGATDTVQLATADYTNMANDSMFTITLSTSVKRPLAGDRLRLVPGSQGGAITDQSGNKPHDLNRSVVLGFRPGPTPIVSAYYLDANADGYLDRIIVGFKRPVQASDISALTAQWKIQPAYQYQTIAVDSIVKLNDSLYSLPLHGDAIRPVQPRTGVEMEIQAEYGAFPGIIRSDSVVDKAGPVVIDTAKLVYANSPDPSILTITFSENVRQPGSHPFYLWSNKYNARYQLKLTWLKTSGNTYTFSVDTLESPIVSYVANGDLIWINTDNLPPVSDTSGNEQRDSLNNRVVLHVIMPLPKWDVHISKNPFIPGTGVGPVINASPGSTALIDADQYSLTITIYDVIGNMVITKSMDQKDKSVANWTYSWDGRNKNARVVGSGVYPAIIRIDKKNGESQTKRIRIGVKR
jgi:hypothetical protein